MKVLTLALRGIHIGQPAAHLLLTLCMLLLVWSLSFTAHAFTLTGRVASATDDTPLAGTTVMLLSLPDSTFISGAFSDRNGQFSLSTSKVEALMGQKGGTQRLLLKLSFIGYQETLKAFSIRRRQRQLDLGDIYMQEQQHILGETVISATPPPMVIREDTIEYYASSYQLEPDATAEDLLKRLPGVEVGTDGSITAQGETVTKVYVDGKEFFGSNIQATTKNLTADMFESVQVVDKKTEESRLTGIDDGEREKVINLKLKPKMRRGWFGNAAGAWGKGSDISDRFETRGMLGYFRGNHQDALTVNANNTNNTGFGDLGDRTMRGSTMRGNRNSGQRGDGLNTSWSVGVNLNYDEGNRLRDENTPLALGGNVLYGGSRQTEQTHQHKVNYLSSGNTGTDTDQTGENRSQNLQFGFKWEQSWGNLEEGEHRIQVSPELAYNSTRTDEGSQSANYHLDPWADEEITASPSTYISQTLRSSQMEQAGASYGISVSYSYAKKVTRGRRRSSITFSLNGRQNDGDQYTQSFTSYDEALVADLRLQNDTTINQWQEERSSSLDYRVRLTHVEPLSEHNFLELSAAGNFTRNDSRQLYHFWDDATQTYRDSVGGRSNIDYSTDASTHQDSYTLSVSYRRVTQRSNASVGMDLLPNSQRYTDRYDHQRDYSRYYMNYAPRIEYRYNWDRRTNLRITLNGQTSQPSMDQLQARKNQTSATHVSLGNQDLDPSFQTKFSARFRTYSQETNRTLEASVNAQAHFNTLATKRWYSPDLRTDTTQTVNLSGLGAWNVQGAFRGSFPFADNQWYITTDTQLGYSEGVGYANLKSTDTEVNHTHTTTASEQAGIAYRSNWLNVEVKANYRLQYTEATIVTSGSLGATHTFGGRLNVAAHLPWNLSLSTDLSYTGRRGYSAGLTRNQTLWNAQLSRSFLERKNLSAFIKVFDILHQKTSLSRQISATAITDRETTTLRQYFLLGCSIRFNRHGGRRGEGRSEGRGEGRRDMPPDDGPRGSGGEGSHGGRGGEGPRGGGGGFGGSGGGMGGPGGGF